MARLKRLLVCGSRDWRDRVMIKEVIHDIRHREGTFVLVHGCASGADTIANLIVRGLGMPRDPFPAKWKTYGRAAGAIRNQEMLDSGIDFVVAFKDGFNHRLDKGGTEDMIRRSLLAGLSCVLYAHDLGAPYTFVPQAHETQASTARVQRRDEEPGPPTLWEHMRDLDVPVTGVPFPSSQAETPR